MLHSHTEDALNDSDSRGTRSSRGYSWIVHFHVDLDVFFVTVGFRIKTVEGEVRALFISFWTFMALLGITR